MWWKVLLKKERWKQRDKYNPSGHLLERYGSGSSRIIKTVPPNQGQGLLVND